MSTDQNCTPEAHGTASASVPVPASESQGSSSTEPVPGSDSAGPGPDVQGSASAEPATVGPQAPFPQLLGIDFGSQKVVVALATPEGRIPVVVRNDISDLQTPSIIAFNGKQRLIGENARGRASIHPESSVSNVATLIGKTEEDFKKFHTPFKIEPGPTFRLPYGDSTVNLTPIQTAAILFKRLSKYIDTSHHEENEKPTRHCCIAVPGGYSSKQKQAVRDAAKIAGFEVIKVVPEHTAVACLYALKRFFPENSENKNNKNNENDNVSGNSESKNVVFVDVGYANFNISLAKMETGKATIVSSLHKNIGGFDFDKKIFDYSAKIIKEKYNFDVTKTERFVSRLFAAAEKTKNTLSTIKETELLFASPDQDIKILISKAQFEELCSAEIGVISATVKEFLSTNGIDKSSISAVEIIGGGSRIPIVSQIVESAFGIPLSHGLDSTLSVGLGAAAYGASVTPGYTRILVEDLTEKNEDEKGLSESDLAHFSKIEEEMNQNDINLEKIAHERNLLESFIFQTKDHLTDKKFEDCFEKQSKEEIEQILKTGSFWLEDNEGIELTISDYSEKLKEIKNSVQNLAPKLFQKLEEIEKEKAKLAAEAAAAAATAAPKKSKPRTNKQKLETAANKKEHGNKLFVDLDYVNAIRRYTQALELLQSLYDETPEQKEEANKLKVQIYLNLSGSFLKLQSWQKAIENAKLVLDIEPDNAKALFRRGQGYYEIKEFELARDDLAKADKATPNNKMIVNLLANSKKEITKRQEREKKMYSQMFSGKD